MTVARVLGFCLGLGFGIAVLQVLTFQLGRRLPILADLVLSLVAGVALLIAIAIIVVAVFASFVAKKRRVIRDGFVRLPPMCRIRRRTRRVVPPTCHSGLARIF